MSNKLQQQVPASQLHVVAANLVGSPYRCILTTIFLTIVTEYIADYNIYDYHIADHYIVTLGHIDYYIDDYCDHYIADYCEGYIADHYIADYCDGDHWKLYW